ncbi:hypothetical protein ACRALDRAFT_2025559 [Sodiomyces alcalophilus JCM 7366]|uniref:uncharacterized protein n=1 Tax=Sodiomyces alcalophilus JCM 7366 TaxID=591952 RepID=UPI0039B38E46
MEFDKVDDLVEDYFKKFRRIPASVHLLCAKVDDDDFEDYDDITQDGVDISLDEKKNRLEDAKVRLDLAYWTSLLTAYPKDKAGVWLDQWNDRMSTALHDCDKCVVNWHMHRKEYLQKFAAKWDDQVAQQLENNLHRYDFARINEGLNWAKEIIETFEERENRAFSRADLGDESGRVLLTIFEALCCMAYLSDPQRRMLFQLVFERLSSKKPLKLGDNVLLPAMTYFLFEKDPTRHRFAVKSWERIAPKSVRQTQFDWAIHDHLVPILEKAAMWDPNNVDHYPDMQQFWEGINFILKALGGEVMLRGIRSLNTQPRFGDLLFSHIHCRSEAILLYVIQALSTILKTAPQVIRDTINDARSFVVVEQIFMTPLIRRLLAQSVAFVMQSPDSDSSHVECATISWIDTWIRSLQLSEKSDACGLLLRLLFTRELVNPELGDVGRAACIRAGLDALEHVLQSFLDPSVNLTSSTISVWVNSTLNEALNYRNIIREAFLSESQASCALGIHRASMKVIKAALSLDSKVMSAEHQRLRLEDVDDLGKKGASVRQLQQAVLRDSPALWKAFSELLEPGRMLLAQNMVLAMGPLIKLDRFRPRRKEPDSIDQVRKRLNDEFQKTAAACGGIMQLLCDFTKEDLSNLLYQGQLIRPVLALNLHAEEDLRDASKEVIKTLTEEFSHSDALLVLLRNRLEYTLASLNFGVRQLVESRILTWGSAIPVITTGRNVLVALSDPTSGLLRSRELDAGEDAALSTWWKTQWAYIRRAFETIGSHWHREVEVKVMEDFCRDTIELADSLAAQCGLIASALQPDRRKGQSSENRDDSLQSRMHMLLGDPKGHLTPIVYMIRLRDKYLVDVTVKVVSRLLTRLRENDHEIPPEPKNMIRSICIKGPDGRYGVPSNANDQQRAELLKALGEDDEVQVVAVQPSQQLLKKKKQSTIDAWSKSAASSAASSKPRSNKDDVLELSSSLDKKRSILDQITSRQTPTTSKLKSLVPTLRAKPDPGLAALIESRKASKAEKAKRDAAAIAKAKALRGTEIKGLGGVVGKDHAPQKSAIMVDSDEDDEDDDSDDGDVQALIAKNEQGQKAVDEATRRRERALLEKTRGPVKKTRIIRSAKDMRARLIPPMDQLHQAILEWDIFYEGNDPPNLQSCKRVADTYMNPDQYRQTFWNLLISEAWRSFVTSKDEATSKSYGIRIASRMTVDRFLEVTASMPAAENKERGLSEGDIILFSKSASPLNDPGEPHALARIWKTAYKRDSLEVTYRLNSKSNPLQGSLHINSDLYGLKITNMTTIEREYAALESLKYYDLMDEILKAEPSPILKYSDDAIRLLMNTYQLNPAQATAILGARDNDGFTCVQGPPGTGKTKTIIAMVGAIMSTNASKKILVCAPSNAAVDELVLRLKQGVISTNGARTKVNVLRLGRSDAINAAVKDVTLDELVKARMEGDTTKENLKAGRDKLHSEAAAIKTKLAELRPQLEAARATDPDMYSRLRNETDSLRLEQRRIGTQIDADKESGNTLSREMEIKRKKVQQEILDSSQVLCATLSGSGHEMFKNLSVDFETVIIDEAAQCVELSALIPLKYGCTKCILVGDPKQLPPTVLSQSAAKFGYDQSLFVRMQRNHPEYIHMLDRQYRMHPEISRFPSQEFYEGKLIDGDDMAALRRRPWHSSPLLGPYRFFDVEGSQEKGQRGRSLVNVQELNVAMKIYERFRRDYGQQEDLKGKIGIITPYKAQLYELRSRFTGRYGEGVTQEIEFNTTDAFQGRECEIIIFSCVRASPTGGIGFMQDIRRMNVGLTRAKSSLWILGDSRALVQGQFWAKLIEDAKQRNLYTRGDIMSMLSKPNPGTLPPAQPRREPAVTLTPSAPLAPLAPSALTAPTGPRDREVSMRDANAAAARAPAGRPTDNRGSGWATSRTDSINERGELRPAVARDAAAPVIQTPAPQSSRTSDVKKRPRDGDHDGAPTGKRVCVTRREKKKETPSTADSDPTMTDCLRPAKQAPRPETERSGEAAADRTQGDDEGTKGAATAEASDGSISHGGSRSSTPGTASTHASGLEWDDIWEHGDGLGSREPTPAEESQTGPQEEEEA